MSTAQIDADSRQAAVDIHSTFWGVHGAFNGEEAHSAMQDVIADLTGEDNAPDVSDPIALASLAEFGAGAHVREHVSQ